MTEALQQAFTEASARLSPTEQDVLAEVLRKRLAMRAIPRNDDENVPHPLRTAFLEDIAQGAVKTDAQRHQQLKRLYELSMSLSGDPVEIFEHVARMIGEVFAVRVVCMSEIVGEELYFKTVLVDGQVFRDAGHCPLAITPCATVESSKDVRVFDHVAERFPHASFLRDHHAFAYCGFPALDNNGRVIAVTCLLDDKPHEFSEDDQELMRIYGQRVALEIERNRHLTERRQAETRQASLAGIIENSRNEIYIFDAETFRFVEVNRAARKNLGYSMEELHRLTPLDLKPTYTQETFSALVLPLRTGAKNKLEFITVHRRKDGTLYPVEVHLQLGEYEARQAFIAIILDITEQKKIETQLRESLHEKETLLREIHHRVKNNLQIIASLLYFHTKHAPDAASAQVFLDGHNRLRAMILVHEQLYRSQNLSQIDFAPYAQSLAEQMYRSYGNLRKRVHLSIKSDAVRLPIEVALPCGMIINELLTNVFKYAFPNEQSGEVELTISRTGNSIRIRVADNGVGLPAALNVSKPTSFGLQLIRNLTTQIHGTLHYERNGGTVAIIDAVLPGAEGQVSP